MNDIKQRLRFHGRFGNEDNVQQAIRKVTEREEAADHIATLEQESATNLQRALVAESENTALRVSLEAAVLHAQKGWARSNTSTQEVG